MTESASHPGASSRKRLVLESGGLIIRLSNHGRRHVRGPARAYSRDGRQPESSCRRIRERESDFYLARL